MLARFLRWLHDVFMPVTPECRQLVLRLLAADGPPEYRHSVVRLSGMHLIHLSDGRLHQGTVYPALRDMEREDLVRSMETASVPERGNGPGRLYMITDAGREWLAAREEQA